MDLSFIRHASLFTRLALLVSTAPLVAAGICIIRPSEWAQTLLRRLSLAAVFAAVASLLLGLANALEAIGRADASLPPAARMLAETLVPSFVGFACLMLAWLCVAVANRRPA